MATGKSVKSLSTSKSSLTKAVSTPKTTTTSKRAGQQGPHPQPSARENRA